MQAMLATEARNQVNDQLEGKPGVPAIALVDI